MVNFETLLKHKKQFKLKKEITYDYISKKWSISWKYL